MYGWRSTEVFNPRPSLSFEKPPQILGCSYADLSEIGRIEESEFNAGIWGSPV